MISVSLGSGGKRVRPREGLSHILLSYWAGSISSHPQHLPVPPGEVQPGESLSISLSIPRNRFPLPVPHYQLPCEEIPIHTHTSCLECADKHICLQTPERSCEVLCVCTDVMSISSHVIWCVFLCRLCRTLTSSCFCRRTPCFTKHKTFSSSPATATRWESRVFEKHSFTSVRRPSGPCFLRHAVKYQKCILQPFSNLWMWQLSVFRTYRWIFVFCFNWQRIHVWFNAFLFIACFLVLLYYWVWQRSFYLRVSSVFYIVLKRLRFYSLLTPSATHTSQECQKIPSLISSSPIFSSTHLRGSGNRISCSCVDVKNTSCVL